MQSNAPHLTKQMNIGRCNVIFTVEPHAFALTSGRDGSSGLLPLCRSKWRLIMLTTVRLPCFSPSVALFREPVWFRSLSVPFRSFSPNLHHVHTIVHHGISSSKVCVVRSTIIIYPGQGPANWLMLRPAPATNPAPYWNLIAIQVLCSSAKCLVFVSGYLASKQENRQNLQVMPEHCTRYPLVIL
jgi:hypothetical protein